ncbi:acetyltransferase (GNAT) family protein [Kushneria sinocarnis]|uniref:Acetyltransferase (GNAT) family protein n=1 Tax=Kushneria sinocarnis TaxID=595502 RepID=A0A420WSS2_9GAMM|nr:GNAT family N-acetyltransferase [Kushneria sinocarnis]RKQ95807.1 acetyltransferase (GNAT) family protein [Kushneria sinocarnis]
MKRWRRARQHDMAQVIDWIDSPRQLEYWAGPGLSWPLEQRRLWREIDGAWLRSRALSGDGHLLAFGQISLRAHRRCHLARILVAPGHRGQGLGEELCRHLIHEARDRLQAQRITLNVFHDNHAARRLYHRLGFIESGTLDERGIQPMILLTDEMP